MTKDEIKAAELRGYSRGYNAGKRRKQRESARKDTAVLARRIAEAAGLRIQGDPTEKPHGRKAWTLLFPAFGDPRFVDLSIMSPNLNSPTEPTR